MDSPLGRALAVAKASAAASRATAAARRVAEVSVATRDAVVESLEEQLAIGLEVVDVASTRLLGCSCRELQDPTDPPEVVPNRRGDGFDVNETVFEDDGQPLVLPEANLDVTPSVLPQVVVDARRRRFMVVSNEYTRLEGYRWQHLGSRGRGTVFTVDQFGSRGECMLCPAFCEAKPPESTPFLEAPDGGRRPADWLRRSLGELCVQVHEAVRLSLEATIRAVEASPSVVLVIPAGTLSFKAQPSAEDFGRKAARRHSHYIDAVEMGARLRLSVVPPANTPSGNLEKVDATQLTRRCGARLFRLSGELGRLCVRNDGGPPMDPFRADGATLDDICAYLCNGWAHTLGANPGTWTRLFVRTERADTLEASIGLSPGQGCFAPARPEELEAPGDGGAAVCSFCSAAPVVGVEVVVAAELPPPLPESPLHPQPPPPRVGSRQGSSGRKHLLSSPAAVAAAAAAAEADSASRRLIGRPCTRCRLCLACSTFVPGSPAFEQKQVLTQHLSHRPIDEVIGTTDEGLDAVLLLQAAPKPLLDPPSKAAAAAASAMSVEERRLHDGWLDGDLPANVAVLAVSGILDLAPPATGWPHDAKQVRAHIETELRMIAGTARGVIRVSEMLPDTQGNSLNVGFYVLHPSLMSGEHKDSHAAQDPWRPLKVYRQIARHLQLAWREANGQAQDQANKSALLYNRPRRIRDQVLKTLMVTNPEQLISQCSLLTCDCPDMTSGLPEDAKKRLNFGKALDQLTGVIIEASSVTYKGRPSEHQAEAERRSELLATWSKSILGKGKDETKQPHAKDAVCNRFSQAVEHFRPDLRQLALRLRELATAGEADKSTQLLCRWGGLEVDGGTWAMMAVLSRNPRHFRGQSALDLAIATRDPATVRALLEFVPQAKAASPIYASEASDAPAAPASVKRIRAPRLPSVQKAGPETSVEFVARAVCVALYIATQSVEEVRQVEYQNIQASLQEESFWLSLELLNTPNPVTGHPPLYTATLDAKEKTVDILERLVMRRADIGGASWDSARELPIAAAARLGERFLVEALLELHADVNAVSPDGRPLLQVAAARGSVGVVEVCVGWPGCEIDTVDSSGRSALITALKGGREKIARILLEAGCSVNVCDLTGAPPILHSVNIKNPELCQMLLQMRADKDAIDPADGSHVLHVAAKARNEPLLRALLRARSNLHAMHPVNGRTVLHIAAGTRWIPVVQFLIGLHAEVDTQSTIGDSALRMAVQQNDIQSAELLCKAGADPNLANRSGCAAIHAAVSQGDVKLAQLLVEYGADVNLADSRRWRPIHYGATGGSADVVSWLMESGADPHARSYHGTQPCDLSRAGASEVLAMVGASGTYTSESSLGTVPHFSVSGPPSARKKEQASRRSFNPWGPDAEGTSGMLPPIHPTVGAQVLEFPHCGAKPSGVSVGRTPRGASQRRS